MNTRSQTLRNTVFSSVGMYTEYVLGMLTSIVIARHLGPEGFGAYGAIIWLVAMGLPPPIPVPRRLRSSSSLSCAAPAARS